MTYTIKEGVEYGLCRVITDDLVRYTIDNEEGELAFLEIDHDFNIVSKGGEKESLLDSLTVEELKA